MNIPQAYVIQKLFSFAHSPTYHRDSGQYNAGCPVCREGTHLGKKKRLYFYTKTNSFYCFNCNKSWNAYTWLCEAGSMSYKDIENDINSNNYRVDRSSDIFQNKKQIQTHTLPYDSINLNDNIQTSYYKDNQYVQSALQMISSRRLSTAINRPQNLYISMKDYIHKNRLCIPFYDDKNQISFYQTRSLDNTLPKYLSKFSAEKTVYGINNINTSLDYIFIFEGPIDAMFVENGVAITGLNMTNKQQAELNRYPLHKKIWVLDNQCTDLASKQKTEDLLKNRSSVFVWPKDIKCKDFNELAVLLKQDSISHKFILNNTNLF